ncbi:MAG: hypothetical protein RBU23_07755 [Candidatus Auribacterota bacterium]|nr:hypothetical protein [Candidatus Auribacterota bacterium]
MKHLLYFCVCLVLLLVCSKGFSDTVILKNGRHLEGKIVEETETSIKIDIGFGAVGFDKSKIDKIERSSDDELQKLEARLEEKRQESIKQAQENEQWYEQQERRQSLIDQKDASAGEQKDNIRQKREEIIQKRKEQLQKLRERREKGSEAAIQPPDFGSDIPQPPSIQDQEPQPFQDGGNVSAPEPETLTPSSPEEDASGGSKRRRIHRLGESKSR